MTKPIKVADDHFEIGGNPEIGTRKSLYVHVLMLNNATTISNDHISATGYPNPRRRQL